MSAKIWTENVHFMRKMFIFHGIYNKIQVTVSDYLSKHQLFHFGGFVRWQGTWLCSQKPVLHRKYIYFIYKESELWLYQSLQYQQKKCCLTDIYCNYFRWMTKTNWQEKPWNFSKKLKFYFSQTKGMFKVCCWQYFSVNNYKINK